METFVQCMTYRWVCPSNTSIMVTCCIKELRQTEYTTSEESGMSNVQLRPEWVSPSEAARHFGVTLKTLVRWAEVGWIRAIRPAGERQRRRYSIASIRRPGQPEEASEEGK